MLSNSDFLKYPEATSGNKKSYPYVEQKSAKEIALPLNLLSKSRKQTCANCEIE